MTSVLVMSAATQLLRVANSFPDNAHAKKLAEGCARLLAQSQTTTLDDHDLWSLRRHVSMNAAAVAMMLLATTVEDRDEAVPLTADALKTVTSTVSTMLLCSAAIVGAEGIVLPDAA